jgi:hypothetical protein
MAMRDPNRLETAGQAKIEAVERREEARLSESEKRLASRN